LRTMKKIDLLIWNFLPNNFLKFMILYNNWYTAHNNWRTAYYTDPEIQFLSILQNYLFFKTPEPEIEQKDCVDY